jgi:cystathionine gamma-synthase
MHIETVAVHAGQRIDPDSGAVTLPIHLSTTFEREPDGSFPHYIYTRENNPTRAALERCVTELEGGFAAAAFASGSAATAALFQALDPGDHVIAPEDAYYGTPSMLRTLFARWGLTTTFVDMRDQAALAGALTARTRLVWIETPSNPRLHVTDIAATAALAHESGALLAVDNTVGTPVLQRPFALGADFIVHSTTKYLSGHSDVLGGIVLTRQPNPTFDRVRSIQTSAGAVAAPFDCWLALRGIRSLPYRMRGHSANARRLAEFLAGHPRVEQVYFPGLPNDPGHALAARQMGDFGGLLSFGVHGGRDAAFAVAARVRLATRATSLGGPETLIEHRQSVEGPFTRAPENLLRVSVGLEHADDLIDDFRQALA